jgi:hypothetical protein
LCADARVSPPGRDRHADQLTPHRLQRVLHNAEHLRLLDAAAIHARLASLPGRRSRTLLQALATLDRGPHITRSELEERFLEVIGSAGLPAPEVNSVVEGFEVDFRWPHATLIAETGGAATHLTPTAFERDRARDAHLTALRYSVVRFTWRRLTDQPAAVVRTVSALLSRGGR